MMQEQEPSIVDSDTIRILDVRTSATMPSREQIEKLLGIKGDLLSEVDRTLLEHVAANQKNAAGEVDERVRALLLAQAENDMKFVRKRLSRMATKKTTKQVRNKPSPFTLQRRKASKKRQDASKRRNRR